MINQARAEQSQGNEEGPLYAVSAAESLAEMRTLTLKNGDTFAVFNRAGDIGARPGGPEGVYHLDTRHLSRFSLTMGGAKLMLLSATLRDDNALLTCDLSNPDLPDVQGHVEHDRIHIRRSRFLWKGACMERIAARNFDRRALTVELELGFAADFADVFEVRGARRERRGAMPKSAPIASSSPMTVWTSSAERRWCASPPRQPS
jgi:glycogen debranching enzyme